MELSELIEEVKKEGKMTNDEIMKYLITSIEDDCEPEEVHKELYRKAFGNKLSDSICRDWVMNLDVTDGSGRTNGEKWNINQTTDIAQRMGVSWDKFTKYEWYAILNAYYSDHFKTGKEFEIENEPEFYASLVLDDFCRDTDAHDKTPFNYYFMFVS